MVWVFTMWSSSSCWMSSTDFSMCVLPYGASSNCTDRHSPAYGIGSVATQEQVTNRGAIWPYQMEKHRPLRFVITETCQTAAKKSRGWCGDNYWRSFLNENKLLWGYNCQIEIGQTTTPHTQKQGREQSIKMGRGQHLATHQLPENKKKTQSECKAGSDGTGAGGTLHLLQLLLQAVLLGGVLRDLLDGRQVELQAPPGCCLLNPGRGGGGCVSVARGPTLAGPLWDLWERGGQFGPCPGRLRQIALANGYFWASSAFSDRRE